MKSFRNSFACVLFLLVCVIGSSISYGQGPPVNKPKVQNGEVTTMVENKSFVFVARSVSPTGGGTRYLTSTYLFQVDSATVVSDLPYFGRVYQPEYGGDAGINFTSRDLEYKSEVSKNGKATVQIKTRDLRNNFQLRLRIFQDGNATLQVSGSDREPITYSGEIVTPENDL